MKNFNHIIKTSKYSLSYSLRTKKINLYMKTCLVESTNSLPNTYSLLEKFLPTIFKNECFNEANIPFYEEVKNTEIGHLFEHILIEYMSQIKARHSFQGTYSGRTFWDIMKNKKDEYKIEIICPISEFPIFVKALKPSLFLFNYIMKEGQLAKAVLPLPYRTYNTNLRSYLSQSSSVVPDA